MKAYHLVDVQIDAVLTSIIDGDTAASGAGCFTLREEPSVAIG
jgi:hypothetical protein